MKHLVVIFCGMILIFGCHMPSPPPTPDPDAELIEKGQQIYPARRSAHPGIAKHH